MKFSLFGVVFLLGCLTVPVAFGQGDSAAATAVVRGGVVDEAGRFVQNATIDVWQLTQKSSGRTFITEWSMKTSIKTDMDGSFNVSIEGGFNYRFYVHTSDLRYVPIVTQKLVAAGTDWELIFRLFPAASIILDGDVLFVDSGNPWISARPLTFSVDPVVDNGVYVYNDPINAQQNNFGLSSRQVIVPANKSVQITVEAAGKSFIIDGLPVLEQGETIHLDILKYSVQCNFPFIQDLLEYVGGRLNETEQKGFYIVAERRDLARASDLLISAKDKFTNGLYEECYADLRQVYVIGEQVSQRILTMYADTAASALVLPFFFALAAAAMSFFMFESKTKKASATCAIYTVLLITFYFTYPSGRIIGVSSFLQAGLVHLGAALFISFLLPRLFGEKAVESRIALRSAIVALFSLAKRGLQRRKLRFILTLITVITGIMGFVALTSISMEHGLIFTGTPAGSSSEGILIREAYLLPSEMAREIPFLPLRLTDVNWLQATEGVSLVAPKTENIPKRETSPLGKLTNEGADKSLCGVLGISPSAEANITGLDMIIEEGRYLYDNDTDAVLLSREAAEELGVTVGSELLWVSGSTTLKTSLVGLIDDYSFESFRDLDGQPLIPQKLYMAAPPTETTPAVWAAKYCDAHEVVVTTWQTALNFSSGICSIWLSRVDAKVEDSARILALTREIALVRTCQVWASFAGQVYFSALGDYAEVGGTFITVPLIMVTLNVAVVVVTSVHERRREVYILSAIGLNPTHITTLFIAEALIIGLIGSTIGYLLGITLYRAFPFFPAEIVVRQKSSILWSLAAMTLGVTVATISSVTQARGASTIATPSLLRKWKIEAKPSEGEPYVFQMPTKIQIENLEFFINYIKNRLQEDYERGIDFSIEQIKRIDEETPEEITTCVTFRYLYKAPPPRGTVITNNSLVIARKRNDATSTVKLVTRGALEEKLFRRIANLVRGLILEWSTKKDGEVE